MQLLNSFALYFVMSTTVGVALYHSYKMRFERDADLEKTEEVEDRRTEYFIDQLQWLFKPTRPTIPELHQEPKK